MNHASTTALMDLAEHVGIISSYKNACGNDTPANLTTIIKILQLLGFAIDTIDDAPRVFEQLMLKTLQETVSPVTVCWQHRSNYLILRLTNNQHQPTYQVTYTINTETGESIRRNQMIHRRNLQQKQLGQYFYWQVKLKLPILACGYHQLTVTILGKTYTSFIISAPQTIYTANLTEQNHCFGLFAPLYALHDEHTMGCGDLTTFRKFARWAATQGSKVIATMPFFAAFLDTPCEPSPYSPVSRLFWNELYLETTGVEGHQHCHFNIEPLIDYHAVNQIKRQLLIQQFQKFCNDWSTNASLQAYLATHPNAHHYALFRAHQELTGQVWQQWPAKERNGALVLTEQHYDRYFFHLCAQWQFDQQLVLLRQELNQQGQLLYLDLPIGSHANGFDVWHYRAEFVTGASVGAPPDLMFTTGQNWGIPPLNPLAMRQQQYRYFISMLRNILHYVDILRIDHVMGFNRLFWIPDTTNTANGVYVRYPADEMYAILCLESHRSKTSIVGENLGCVPIETNQLMAKHHMLQMHILQYVLESNQSLTRYPKLALASLNTHDMPTFQAYCQVLDLIDNPDDDNDSNQTRLAHRQQQFSRLKKLLARKKLPIHDLLTASLLLLAQSPALIVTLNVEDLWREALSQNNPGALKAPNWRRRFAYSLREFNTLDSLIEALKLMRTIRPNQLLKETVGIATHD